MSYLTGVKILPLAPPFRQRVWMVDFADALKPLAVGKADRDKIKRLMGSRHNKGFVTVALEPDPDGKHIWINLVQ